MNHEQTLIHHREIRSWVTNNHGVPAIVRVRDDFGDVKARLALSFQRPKRVPSGSVNQDDGMTPVSWAAWLAELDRQQLALRVANAKRPSFEFVERRELH